MTRLLLVLALSLAIGACQRQSLRTDPANEVIVAAMADPVSFDPANNMSASDGALLDLVYQQLTAIDPTSANGQVVGELAESWTVSDDGLIWTFVLRDGQKFDDGANVDAEAVRFSFERVRTVGRSAAEFLSWVSSIEVVDDRTVRLSLTRPFAAAAAFLALPSLSIVNPAAVAAHEADGDHGGAWLSDNSAGSGPYRLAQWRRGRDFTLEANPQSATPPRQFRRVVFSIVPNDATRRLQLRNGDIDYVAPLGAAAAAEYAEIENVNILRADFTMDMRFLTINTERISDPRVRQAIAAAIDYQALQEQILAGNVGLISGYLPPNVPGGDPNLPLPQRDLARAQELLRDAGYDPSRELSLMVGGYGPVSEFLQAQLRDAGINVRLQRLAPSAIEATRATGDFDLFYDGWVMDVPDPAIFFNLAFSSNYRGSGINASRYSTPELDAELDAAATERDPERRAALYRSIEAQLIAARPVVMLFATLPIAAARSDLAGVRVNPYQTTYLNIPEWTRTP